MSTERYDMGHNDVLGSLRLSTDSLIAKREWAQRLLDGHVALPLSDAFYREGARAAARLFLHGYLVDYQGPPEVVDYMEATCGAPECPDPNLIGLELM